ncbi:discoidin domain-containing protein [Pectobacterium brasiliense]|uniref:discoidin domain-containing protein n=1 Tax=Pectobacterium brasiliense TaxID=180957 RepID=UPI002A834679|nr:discoidin domain-containing protein [Pectobacterium brasiliense]MDY4326548.1 discoidin domain-containing protein [Pectobacterium brasiliense]
MQSVNIEINVCDSTGKSTCTVNPPIQLNPHSCCHSDSGSGQEPGVSGVTSVFGRTGVVTAQPGDYTADQITETATRKFASPDEKAVWNAKQDALISGTTIRTLFGQSLLGSGDFSPTPAQMGVAAADHTHTTVDITDYAQKTKQLIHSSLEAGAGVTLSYNPVNEKTIISAVGGSGSGSSGYVVADRQGATAGQSHTFSVSSQNTFNLAAYALKEEAGAANQTYVVDDFNASSEPNYHVTSAVIFDGMASLYTGSNYQFIPDGDFYSAEIKADGKEIDISLINASSSSIIPLMTSNTLPVGYTASASNESLGTYKAFIAFDGSNNSGPPPNCWGTDGTWVPSVARPHWLQIDLPSKEVIGGYQITNRSQLDMGNVRTWKLQGSNDNGVTWSDLHSVTDDVNNDPGAVRNFTLSQSASYKTYRLLITAINGSSPYVTISELKFFSPNEKFVINTGGKNYGFSGNVLTEITGELTSEKISLLGVSSVDSLNTTLPNFTTSVKLISAQPISVRTTYTPLAQSVTQKLLTPAGSWSQINSATLTATQTGKGKVRVAVTRDLINWHVLRNGAWVDVGALSADTTGAEALIADGMTPAELGGITAAQWAQLFASNNGVPDSLAFAFALDITDPVTDVATIDQLVLNVNDASSWKVQSPAEVEIRWRTDSVTFRTATAGNYKLAYQVP